jgi:hypothetical protein
MNRIINELKEAIAKGNGGALLQLNKEETQTLLKKLERLEVLERHNTNAGWAEENRLQEERNRGYEQGQL